MDSCRYGLNLCIELILPSLFPFFLLSALLSRLGFPAWLGSRLSPFATRLFRVSGEGITALLIGLTGGYPMGAAYLGSLVQEKRITEQEAEHLLGFCNNSGPAFLIGAVGVGVFGSSEIGLLLYVVHILGALLTGIILRGKAPAAHKPICVVHPSNSFPFSVLLTDAVRQTVTALLNVCGFVVTFTVFTGLLNTNGFMDHVISRMAPQCFLDPALLRAVLTGFWELGSGIGALRGIPPTPLALAMASGIVGWGGLSVHFQTYAVLSDTTIKGTLHTTGRLLSAFFSFFLTFALASVRS